jgi:mono/diheme cytochrome c family protein
MKLSKILPLVPIVALLASCGNSEIKLSADQEKTLVSEAQTQAPNNFVVYPDDRPSIVDGRALFEKQNCASCHGATGAGGTGPALNDKRMMSNIKPVELYQFLTYGKNGVQHPALKDKLTNREIWNLVFYSKALGTPPLNQADTDMIMPVFGSNCAVCHGTKGVGDGPLATNLEPNPANFSTMRRFFDRTDDVLYDHIANGIYMEGMPNFLGKEDRKKNFKFDHESIRKLVAYVRSFSVNGEGFATIAAADTGAAAPGAAAMSAAPTAAAAAAASTAANTPSAASSAPSATSPATAGEASADAKPAADKAAQTTEAKPASTSPTGK